MPKSLMIDPIKLRQPGTVSMRDIPVNQYQKTPEEEKKLFTKDDFLRILRDMAAIREFELMLNEIKIKGSYGGKEFTYPGPAHTAVGEEAAAVGAAYHLGVEDFVFGSHRSHHEIIAKAFSAIEKLPYVVLTRFLVAFHGGQILKAVEGGQQSVKELALDFFLYGAMCELFAKENGFSHGLGGSMHAFFLPFGIYPNNAIVGGSGPIATGAALYKRCNRKPGIVVANLGDGSVGCGPVWESLNFAAMDQYNTLWDKDHKGGLPILFNFTNNGYGMGGQTAGETMAYSVLARIGAGIAPSQLHTERVDGFNPLAVIDAYARKKPLLEKGEGPCLLDVLSYRFSGHSPSDASSYRTPEEADAWKGHDPMTTYPAYLVDNQIATQGEIDDLLSQVAERNRKAFRLSTDLAVSPYIDYEKKPLFIENLMFSHQRQPRMEDRPCEVLLPMEENPRVQQIAKKVRFALDAEGKALPKTRVYNLRDGLFEAILHSYYTDPTLVSYGEDVRDWGGAFAVYRGLTEALPYHRLFNAPISEAAIVGSAVGYAMAGGRAIVELMYCDFIGRAGDEVFNQLSKWQSMSAGHLKMPVVLRVSVGSKYGAQHSQDWTAMTAHIPGLKVCFPATPYDAKGLMNAALAGTDPVVFFESQRIYDIGEMFHPEGVPEGYYEIPIGEPDIKRAGSDVTILSVGAALYRALDAAKMLEETYNLSAEVIDARSVVPFDYAKVLESVKKTGRVLLVSDASARGSILNDMAQNITQLAFDHLDAPPVVVGSQNWITPAPEHDSLFFPQPSWILDAIHQKLLPLPGYTPVHSFTPVECMRKAKMGV